MSQPKTFEEIISKYLKTDAVAVLYLADKTLIVPESSDHRYLEILAVDQYSIGEMHRLRTSWEVDQVTQFYSGEALYLAVTLKDFYNQEFYMLDLRSNLSDGITVIEHSLGKEPETTKTII